MKVEYYDHLPNKPLVEAILEIKWGLPDRPDPAYPLIVGRLYEKMRGRYEAIEDLDLAQFPPAIAVHVPRHRFRITPNQWPLVQIGPGVAALNDTEAYTWQDFKRRALEFFPAVHEAHPRPEEMAISSLKLEYIDAVDFDYEQEDVKVFLRDKLHIGLDLPNSLFEGQPIADYPRHASVQVGFATGVPRGRIQLSVTTGQREGRLALILHTFVLSTDSDAQEGWRAFEAWLDAAHAVIRHWFFALVQGELLGEFLGA
jgi:uncharacterized protein (TIGR04255 family)